MVCNEVVSVVELLSRRGSKQFKSGVFCMLSSNDNKVFLGLHQPSSC